MNHLVVWTTITICLLGEITTGQVSNVGKLKEIPAYVKFYDKDSTAPIFEWEEKADGVGHFTFSESDFGAGYSFLEQGESVMAAADPQNLAPQALQCYCKFDKPKIETVPASAYNNEANPTDFVEVDETDKYEGPPPHEKQQSQQHRERPQRREYHPETEDRRPTHERRHTHNDYEVDMDLLEESEKDDYHPHHLRRPDDMSRRSHYPHPRRHRSAYDSSYRDGDDYDYDENTDFLEEGEEYRGLSRNHRRYYEPREYRRHRRYPDERPPRHRHERDDYYDDYDDR